MAVYFDGALINMYWLHRRGRLRAHGSLRTLFIGEAPDVTVPCTSPALPAARFPLVRGSRGGPGYTLLCPASLVDGSLLVNREPATLQSLLPHAAPCADYPGVLEIALRSGVELTLNLGLVSLRVSACQLPRRLALAPGLRVSHHVPTAFVALLAGAVAALASSVPPSPRPLWGAPDFTPHISMSIASSPHSGAAITFHRAAPAAKSPPPGSDTQSGRAASSASRSSSSSRFTKGRPPGRATSPPEPSFAELIGKQSILGDSATAMAEIDGQDSAGGIGGIGGNLVGTGGGFGEGSIAIDGKGFGMRGDSRSCFELLCESNAPPYRGGQLGHRTSGSPEITVGDAVMTCSRARGCADKELIRRVVRRHVNEVRYCYERALITNPALQGRVGIRFTIDSAGRVERSEASSSTVADPAVGTCIADAVRRFTFPALGGGITEVSYPFELQRS